MSKKMKRWSVIGSVTGGKYLVVFEAKTADEAIEKAINKNGGMISLCHQCSSECDDGTVEEASAEETNEPVEEDL